MAEAGGRAPRSGQRDTARDRLDDLIEGLDAGADDCLIKPFELAELAARVRAPLRRRIIAANP